MCFFLNEAREESLWVLGSIRINGTLHENNHRVNDHEVNGFEVTSAY